MSEPSVISQNLVINITVMPWSSITPKIPLMKIIWKMNSLVVATTNSNLHSSMCNEKWIFHNDFSVFIHIEKSAKQGLFSQANRSPVSGSSIWKFLWGVCNLRRLLKVRQQLTLQPANFGEIFFTTTALWKYVHNFYAINSRVINCTSKCSSWNTLLNTAIKFESGFIVNILPNSLQLVSNSQRALDFESCSILSSQSPSVVRQICFPLPWHLSSELQVLIHFDSQVKRIMLSAIPCSTDDKNWNFTVKKSSRFDASYC